MKPARALREVHVPDEAGAQERAWAVVRTAYRDACPAPPRRSRLRIVLLPVLIAVVGGIALSPAGATVARWVKSALGVRHPAPALFSLPASGRVLVSGAGGTWMVFADGSARRLGDWPQASWSPHGLYVAVARGDQLAAVNSHGVVQWTLARAAVSDPRWYAPSGYRVAYLSGHTLRMVAGDGSDDRPLASGVLAVAPAWRPGHPYQLAYVTRAGRLTVRNADTGRSIWTTKPSGRVRALQWSQYGTRLLVLTDGRATLYGPAGGVMATIPAGGRVFTGSLSPNGHKLALIRQTQAGAGTEQLAVANLESSSRQFRAVFSGSGIRQLAWSPNGRWLLVSWPAADQWVFVRVAGKPRITAVSRIAKQFGGTGTPGGAFPRLDGWCCAPWRSAH
jgi:hypothetical protein